MIKALQRFVLWCRNSKRAALIGATALLFGGLSGVGSAFLIAMINTTISGAGNPKSGWGILFLCLAVPATGLLSQLLIIHLTEQHAYDLRVRLANQLLSTPYRQLERIGTSRLLAAITDDVRTITLSIAHAPYLITQAAIVTGSLVYLGVLSPSLLIVTILYIIVSAALHQVPYRKGLHYWKRYRDSWDLAYKMIKALIDGIKELKINHKRSHTFTSADLEPSLYRVQIYNEKSSRNSELANSIAQGMFYLFIGLMLVVVPHALHLEPKVFSGYIIVILFMVSPLHYMLTSLPSFGRAFLAAERIDSLGLAMDTKTNHTAGLDDLNPEWSELRFTGVTYRYDHSPNANEQFVLGPLDITIHRGEIIYILGANGSGKTTMARLLIGLYEPHSGEIRLDERVIDDSNRANYLQLFSVVFFDFYLFERLVARTEDNLKERLDQHLAKLSLADRVKIEDQVISDLNLSQGQRKRLALLSAYLEDRSIYVFDEWAADQDPGFKEVFYSDILSDLKDQNKTVIVITHDMHYLEAADRIIRLDAGGILTEEPPVMSS